jgi:hypothetical protein
MGSSHVGQLNTTHITNQLNTKKITYEVFNLSYNSDTPERRTQFVDEIIALKPTLVIYGLSYRDFQTSINENPLPDPKYFFNQLFDKLFHKDITVNPKLITLNFIRNLQKDSSLFRLQESRISFPDTPFFDYNIETQGHIASKIELEKQSQTSEALKLNLETPDKNKQVQSLVNLIQKFQQNDIKIVLFLTPLNKYYLITIPDSQNAIFNATINYIKDETNVSIYDLRYKYSEMEIWANISHVAFNTNSLIYSNDIAEIIQSELGS